MKMKTYMSILVAVVALTTLSTMAQDAPKAEAEAKPAAEAAAPAMPELPELPEFSPDTVVLKINDKEITLGELDAKLNAAQVPEYQRGSYYPRVLEMMAMEIIQDEFIKSKGLKVNEETYAERLADLEKRYQEALERMKQQVEEIKGKIKTELILEDYTTSTVTDEAIAKYIADNPRLFDDSKVTVSHVLIECKSFASSEEKAAALKKLQGIYEQIMAGEISFEDAAKQFSSCPSKEKGGDLGEIDAAGRMDKYFTEMAFKTDVGEISKPFLTSFGYHIVKVTDATYGEGKPITTKVRGKDMTPEELAKTMLSAKVQNQMIDFATDKLKIENIGLPTPKAPAMPAMPGM